jgi:hypothetical protein
VTRDVGLFCAGLILAASGQMDSYVSGLHHVSEKLSTASKPIAILDERVGDIASTKKV